MEAVRGWVWIFSGIAHFNAYKDFHESETIASILAAWMEFTGMDSTQGKQLNKFLIYLSHNSELELH